MSLHYLVKLSIRALQVNSSWDCEPKNTSKCFCHIFYKTRPILIKFGTYFPDEICQRLVSMGTRQWWRHHPLLIHFDTIPVCDGRTHRRTDRRTERSAVAETALSMAARCITGMSACWCVCMSNSLRHAPHPTLPVWQISTRHAANALRASRYLSGRGRCVDTRMLREWILGARLRLVALWKLKITIFHNN